MHSAPTRTMTRTLKLCWPRLPMALNPPEAERGAL
jgi:hypothetical protein